MIPYDIDPSLYSAEPEELPLDDGCSPRGHGEAPDPARKEARLEDTLAPKSDF